MHKNQQNAFTLIELLVVIAIIGILSSVVLAALSGARESARDARRASDFDQLRTAMEMYYNDHGSYPGGSDTGVNHLISNKCSGGDLYSDLVGGGYMQSMITDPAESMDCTDELDTVDNGEEYFYGWDASNAGGNYCFGINRFESSDDAGSLENINQQPSTSFGYNSNLSHADFVYCFEE